MPFAPNASNTSSTPDKRKKKKKPYSQVGGPSQAATEAIQHNLHPHSHAPTPAIDAGVKDARRRERNARREAEQARRVALAHLQATIHEPQLEPWRGLGTPELARLGSSFAQQQQRAASLREIGRIPDYQTYDWKDAQIPIPLTLGRYDPIARAFGHDRGDPLVVHTSPRGIYQATVWDPDAPLWLNMTMTAGWFTGPFRIAGGAIRGGVAGSRAISAGVDGYRAAKLMDEGFSLEQAARQVVHESVQGARAGHAAPIRGAIQDIGGRRLAAKEVRQYRVGPNGEVGGQIQAAGSRAGRIVERALDATRPIASKLTMGAIRSETFKAGEELGRTLHSQQAAIGAIANGMRQTSQRMNVYQQWAVKSKLEGVDPRVAEAVHKELALEFHAAGKGTEAADHNQLAAVYRGAQRYISPELEFIGPRQKMSHRLFDLGVAAGKKRDEMLADGLMLSEAAIAGRIQAPGRIYGGARWYENEAHLQAEMRATPEYRLFKSVAEEHLGADQAEALMTFLEATVRSMAKETDMSVMDAMRQLAHTATYPEGPLARSSLEGNLAGADEGLRALGLDQFYPESVPAAFEERLSLPARIPAQRIADDILKSGAKLPKELPDRKAFADAIQNVYQMAKQSAPHKDWYQRARRVIDGLAEYEGVDADKVAQLMAIYSQATDTVVNVKFVRDAIEQFKRTGSIENIGRFPARQAAEADAVMKGGTWSGRKRSSFYKNMMETNPHDEVTVDRWVVRMFEGEKAGGAVKNEGFYDTYEKALQGIARELGWEPREVQAAAWVTIKQNALNKRGIKAIGGQDAFERGLGKYYPAMQHAERVGEDPIEAGVRDTMTPGVWGHTWDASGRSFHPDHGYAIPSDVPTVKIPTEEFGPDDVKRFIASHQDDVRRDPSLRFGAWNDEVGNVHLDVSRYVESEREASRIRWLENREDIYDFGTGKKMRPLPPEEVGVRPEEIPSELPEGAVDYTGTEFDPNRQVGEAMDQPAPQSFNYYRDLVKHDPELVARLGERPTQSSVNATARLALAKGDTKAYDALRREVRENLLDAHPGFRGRMGMGGPKDSPVNTKAFFQFVKDAGDGRGADLTNFVHELAHFRQFFGEMGIASETTLARAFNKRAGKEVVRPVGKIGKFGQPEGGWEWTNDGYEMFAQAFVGWMTRGEGPAGTKNQMRYMARIISKEIEDDPLRAITDLSVDEADVYKRLLRFDRLKGGKLRGAEEFDAGIVRVPVRAGTPTTWRQPFKSTMAYMRKSNAVFGGGRRTAISQGPADAALKKTYKGGLILKGRVNLDWTKAMADDLMLAARMTVAHRAREILVRVGADLPTMPSDVAVKVDPKHDVPDKLKRLWDRWDSLEHDGVKLTAKDMEELDGDLIQQAQSNVFPDMIDGEDTREVAARLANDEFAEPIDNIKWVPREFLDASGLLYSPKAISKGRFQRGGRATRSALDVTANTLNDVQRALILYLNPAYIPVNFLGNTVMNLMQQGMWYPRNMYRAAKMHSDFDYLTRKTMDEIMGTGLTGSLMGKTRPMQAVNATLGHWVQLATDMMPRRAALIHELYREGYDNPEKITALMQRVQGGHWDDQMDLIKRRANDAIVDFERLGPTEREMVTKWIFFYPWLKGATRWTARFAFEHPLQAAALVMLGEHAYHETKDIVGEEPWYAKTQVALNTRALGVDIPGLGEKTLADLIGEHAYTYDGMPMTFDARQLITATTPLDLVRAGVAFAMGEKDAPALVQNLTPVPYAAGVALFGYDPFEHKEVDPGIGTFFNQLAQVPERDRFQAIMRSPSERADYAEFAYHPRSRQQEVLRTFFGGIAPAPTNPRVGAEQHLESLPTYERNRQKLIADSHSFGLGDPPPQVLEEQKIYYQMEEELQAGMPSHEKAAIAAKYFDQEFPSQHVTAIDNSLKTEAGAQPVYEQLRAALFPTFYQWRTQIARIKEQQAGAQTIP